MVSNENACVLGKVSQLYEKPGYCVNTEQS